MAFYFFATPEDMAEIFADLEAVSPVRIVYEHERTGTTKACYESASDIPGFSDADISSRHRPGFLVFPFQCEPVMTEVEVPTRTVMCIYRTDNPDAVAIRQPSMLYVESLKRPELRAGELDFFAVSNVAGEPGPTEKARLLARQMRKMIRRRSVRIHSEGAKRVYIARRALEMAQRGEIDLYWQHVCWSAADVAVDEAFLGDLHLPASADRPNLSAEDTGHNIVPIRKFSTKRVAFREPTEPDILFIAAYDDLVPIFEAAHLNDDLNYSRLGSARYRGTCPVVSELSGLGASHTKRDLTSGIVCWRGDSDAYGRVCEPYALADYRIGLLPDGYIAPSIAVFPGGVLLRGRAGREKALYSGYGRVVHASGEEHFTAFQEALLSRHERLITSPDLPNDLVVLPRAASLMDAGFNPDHSILSMQMMQHRLNVRPSNVVSFPLRPDSTAV